MDQYITVIVMIMPWFPIIVRLEGVGVNYNIGVRNVSMVKEQCTPHKQQKNHQQGESAYFI